MRSKPATPEEKLATLQWCLHEALLGNPPPTETGLDPATIDALRHVADAATPPTFGLVLYPMPDNATITRDLTRPNMWTIGPLTLDDLTQLRDTVTEEVDRLIHSQGCP